MSVATDHGLRVLDHGSRASGEEDRMEARLSRLLLRAVDAHQSRHSQAPTVSELAVDLGITPEFGHDGLVARLRREVSLGHVSHYRGRYGLTRAGRAVAEPEA